MEKTNSLRSYIFLIVSALLSICIFVFFAFVETSETIVDIVIYSCYLLVPASIILAIVTLTKKEWNF